MSPTPATSKTPSIPEVPKGLDEPLYNILEAMRQYIIAVTEINRLAAIEEAKETPLVEVFSDIAHTHTPAQVGLGSVTNDAQVKKMASGTDNALVKQNGTSGDTIQNTGIQVDDDDNLYGHGSKINKQTGTSYTLTASDNGKIVLLTNASAITLTLPQTSTEALPEGFQCVPVQGGAGQVTVVAEGTDSIVSPDSKVSLRTQGSPSSVLKQVAGSPNTWNMFGDLA